MALSKYQPNEFNEQWPKTLLDIASSSLPSCKVARLYGMEMLKREQLRLMYVHDVGIQNFGTLMIRLFSAELSLAERQVKAIACVAGGF